MVCVLYSGEVAAVTVVQHAGRAPGLIWTGLKKRKALAPPGFEAQIYQPAANGHTDYENPTPT